MLFWVITRRVVIISYHRIGTTYRPQLQGSRIQMDTRDCDMSNAINFESKCAYSHVQWELTVSPSEAIGVTAFRKKFQVGSQNCEDSWDSTVQQQNKFRMTLLEWLATHLTLSFVIWKWYLTASILLVSLDSLR